VRAWIILLPLAAIAAAPGTARTAAPTPAGCPEGHFAYLETDTRMYRQGATIAIRPMVNQAPGGSEDLPARCVGRLSVSGPARLGADKRSLVIDRAAAVGSEIAIGFRYRGEPVVTRLRVIARDAVTLTGTWHQKSTRGCEAAETVGELEFTPDGTFSVTYQPFESYRDYWGPYRFDPATGAIAMSVEGGNFVPAESDLIGSAELAAGTLTLSGVNFGNRSGAPSSACTYIF